MTPISSDQWQLYADYVELFYQLDINGTMNHPSFGPDAAPICFPPLSSGSESALVLGSFPGQLSLEKQQYYAHPRNSFWPIMGNLFGFDPLLPYSERAELLTRNNIALWDVLFSCNRKGSLDASIKKGSIRINDFETFFTTHRSISAIFFNGALAENQFVKNVLSVPKIQNRSLFLHRLPSTSPAMAMLSFKQKLEAWKIVSASAKQADTDESANDRKEEGYNG